jgi:hypothetical protein
MEVLIQAMMIACSKKHKVRFNLRMRNILEMHQAFKTIITTMTENDKVLKLDNLSLKVESVHEYWLIKPKMLEFL